jgi:ribosome-associated protein
LRAAVPAFSLHEGKMLHITPETTIPEDEIEIRAIRAQGPGGQNVNKVSSAIHLRFDIPHSSLPEEWKSRLLQTKDNRLTRDGVLVIKAQRSRSQEKNREEALNRLQLFISGALAEQQERIATRPSRSVRKKRLEQKRSRSQTKSLRAKVLE